MVMSGGIGSRKKGFHNENLAPSPISGGIGSRKKALHDENSTSQHSTLEQLFIAGLANAGLVLDSK
jgi:hypothetical protein